jgi:uncharacterized protein
MKKEIFLVSVFHILVFSYLYSQPASLLNLEPVGFSNVRITDEFWKPKIDLVSTVTLKSCVYQTETATPRIRNFKNVAEKTGAKHEGFFYDDSDVYKALEAIAYSLKDNPDPILEKKADEWIGLIASAQQPDGYLNTFYSLTDPNKSFTDMSMHEDYCGGHLIEAAVAYYNATGKRKLLDVAIKWANQFDSIFGPGKRHWVTGHQELELALVKLYKTTSDERYLLLAEWLLSERGHGYAVGFTWSEWKDTAYAQDVMPVKEQKEITGHAVRAMYMYTGAADVASLTGDSGYMQAMETVWDDVVGRNMYLTGGIGSSGSNEGFTKDYDLPNDLAYCETCASVGMVFWNQRMNLLTGEAKYIDILERSLYNGALDGLSLEGNHFFYGNPLSSSGKHYRKEWFGTACCPSNIARLILSLGGYIYAKNEAGIWINLFIGSETMISIGKVEIGLKMETSYPMNGNVRIKVSTKKPIAFTLHLRRPGWSSGIAAPGDLYRFIPTDSLPSNVSILINHVPVSFKEEEGYLLIDRVWKEGDIVDFLMDMDIKEVTARDEVKADLGRIALQRGPLVYCIEGADNRGKAFNVILPENTPVHEREINILNEKVVAISATVPVIKINEDGKSVSTEMSEITAIPYYTWCNRGSNPMQVWIPRKIREVILN